VAGDEHQAQHVVADVVVGRDVGTLARQLPLELELVAELRLLALEQLAATQPVDGPMLRGWP
jgi:hypothetical protein